MSVKVRGIEWNDKGFGHTPVGIMFHVEPYEDLFILTRYESSGQTKSSHEDKNAAKAWAQIKYNQIILSAIDAN